MARYYTLYLPNQMDDQGNVKPDQEPYIYTNVRKLKDLPEGTRINKCITDRDGSLVDVEGIPVVNGKPQIAKRGIRRARMSWQV